MPALRALFFLLLKGAAMGAANVIPGVSGGTVAFITGIYEQLMDTIKSFNLSAIKMLFKGNLKGFWNHINGWFLLPLVVGVALGILIVAKVLTLLFESYEVLTTAFFFGLIVGSVLLVGKEISKWSISTIFLLVIGAGIAVGLAFLKPAAENDNMLYLFVCGIAAISSMILPGLSGSYVLLIMGNYLLILNAVNDRNIMLLLPVAIGSAIGLVGFSHILSFIYKKFRNETLGLLTGFVLGSLLIIWPWKSPITASIQIGDELKIVEKGYEWMVPPIGVELWMGILLACIGFGAVLYMEKIGKRTNSSKSAKFS